MDFCKAVIVAVLVWCIRLESTLKEKWFSRVDRLQAVQACTSESQACR